MKTDTTFPFSIIEKLAKEHIYLNAPASHSLLSGDVGLGLFLIQDALQKKAIELPEAVNNFLKKYIGVLENENLTPDFGQGLFGVGWLLSYLSNLDVLELDEEDFADLDQAIYHWGIKHFSDGNYDAWYGGIGAGLYFLERGTQTPFYQEMLEHLSNTAIEDEQGIRWINQVTLHKFGRKTIDFGFAHGLPSIMVFLAHLYERNIERKKAQHIIDGILKFMALHTYPDHPKNQTPSIFSFEEADYGPVFSSRVAFCYGDLGAAYAYLFVSKKLGYKWLEEKAIQLALKTTHRKDLASTEMEDAGLCHGFHGAAYIYYKLYRMTDEKAFKMAADFWLEHGLHYLDRCGGIDQFLSKQNLDQGWAIDHSFLMGSSGVALVQMTIENDLRNSGWDRMMLLS